MASITQNISHNTYATSSNTTHHNTDPTVPVRRITSTLKMSYFLIHLAISCSMKSGVMFRYQNNIPQSDINKINQRWGTTVSLWLETNGWRSCDPVKMTNLNQLSSLRWVGCQFTWWSKPSDGQPTLFRRGHLVYTALTWSFHEKSKS